MSWSLESREKCWVLIKPSSKVIVLSLTVMIKHGYIGKFEVMGRTGKITVNITDGLNQSGGISLDLMYSSKTRKMAE